MRYIFRLPPPLNQTYKIGLNRKTGAGSFYMDGTAKAWKEEVQLTAKKIKPLPESEITAHIDWYFKRDRDADSAVKLIFDALIGIAYKDDKQIVAFAVTKQKDQANPRVEVTIDY